MVKNNSSSIFITTLPTVVISEYSFYVKSYMKSTVLIPLLYLQLKILVHSFHIQFLKNDDLLHSTLYDYAAIYFSQ